MNNLLGGKSVGHGYVAFLFKYFKRHGYMASNADPWLVSQTVGSHHIFVTIKVAIFVVSSRQSLND